MMRPIHRWAFPLFNRRAQILLPSVLLAPIFVLVIYLLFETSKVSMTKVREQFALDNAAYSQLSSASTYLNAVAMINANMPYRVMKTYNQNLQKAQGSSGLPDVSVFDLFYVSGAFPALGANGSELKNPNPAAESVDWKTHYYKDRRSGWIKEEPSSDIDGVKCTKDSMSCDYYEKDGQRYYAMTSPVITRNYYFPAIEVGLPLMRDYITTFIRTGSIFDSQTYSYNSLVDNARMFREGYYLNVDNCKKADCARESAAVMNRYHLTLKPYKIAKIAFYVSENSGAAISGSYAVPLDLQTAIKDDLFQFAYTTSSTRSKLHTLQRGVLLKQKYTLPRNHFNINLAEKFKPYVRNKVALQCPRNDNNCVWPHTLPKYNVKVMP